MRQPVAYLRKSRIDPGTRDASWEIQEAKVRALAARHGDNDLELLSDWGRSGRGEKTRLRPEYARLREMIETDQVSVLYSYSLSRLARSLTEYASLAELCREHGVKVRLEKEGEFDYTTASGRFIVGMLALLAQMEAELAQERARDTIEARRARGDHVGSAGYGKRLNAGRLEDNPREDLDTVIAAYREAGSLSGAARTLNTAAVRSKFGKRWSASTVKRVLETGGELAGRKVEARVAQRSTYMLGRLLKCHCGNILTGRASSVMKDGRKLGPYLSYQCYRSRFEVGHSLPAMMSERRLLPWVREEVARLMTPGEIMANDEADPALPSLNARRARVIDAYLEGLIDKERRARELEEIDAQIERLEVRAMPVPVFDWSWPPEQVNAVLRAVFGHIELGPDMLPVRAVWRVPEWRLTDDA
jgi:DNA invertase Pin-like site-specific DNA recombinase